MNFGVMVFIDDEKDMLKGIIVEYLIGKNRVDVFNKVLEIFNLKLLKNVEVVDFEVGIYVIFVMRRVYGVVVVVYNVFIEQKFFEEFIMEERWRFIVWVFKEFNYNLKVLNILEFVRMFGVLRDLIYYDIQQILKEK